MIRALVLVCLLPACTTKPRCGSGPARLELRDGEGVLQMRVAESGRAGELDLCDPAGQRAGALARQGEALVLFDRANAERLRVTRADGLELISPRGPGLRLFRKDGMLRVLHADGVPVGSLHELDSAVLVSDAGGSPLSKVARRDADAVLASPEGTVRGFVVPSPGLVAAGMLALAGLPLEERLLLAAHVGRGRLLP